MRISRETVESYSSITEPGVYKVTVINSHRIFDVNLGSDKYIVNCKAVAAHNTERIRELFSNTDSVPVELLNGLIMSGNIPIRGEILAPIKGQEVTVSVDYVKARSGQMILAIKAITYEAAKIPEPFRFPNKKTENISVTEDNSIQEKII